MRASSTSAGATNFGSLTTARTASDSIVAALCCPEHLQASGYDLIIDWYRTRGFKWLRPQVDEWAARLRVKPASLEVADLGHKWGSATSDGQVRVHWATLQLRRALVDYVLAHELAHLHEPHHGPAFWASVARVMPDYEDRRALLARVGATLWFGEHPLAPADQTESSAPGGTA